MDYEGIFETMSHWLTAYASIRDTDAPFLFRQEQPATGKEISAMENQLNHRLPNSLRMFFLHHTRHLEYDAYFSNDFMEKLPTSLHSIYSASLDISLENLPMLNQSCQESIALCLTEAEHPSAAHLQNVLPLTWVSCGDFLIFDYNQNAIDPPVLYLDLYAGEHHCSTLGHSFADFLERYIAVGLCGPEDCQMAPFLPNKTDGIQPDCPNAKAYRELFFKNK